MDYKPTIVQPNNPQPQPSHDSVSPPTTSHMAPISAEAALHQSLHRTQQAESIATRLPNLKKWTLILLGIIIFSAVQTLALKSVMVSMLGSHDQSGGFLTITMIVAWLVGTAASIMLLTTKDAGVAKKLLFAIGAFLAYTTLTDIIGFNIIGLVIDGFLLWKAYDLYQSIEALEMKPFSS